MRQRIHHPPISANMQGKPRRVGFEIEYAGVPLESSASIIARCAGGNVVEKSKSHYAVEGTAFGDFDVKLDVSLVQKISSEAARLREEEGEWESFESMAEKLLSPIASAWMPNEIVTPPILIADIGAVDDICQALQAQGAKGTGASPVYAFGLHINPDLPQISPERLRDYLAAFVVLQEVLRERVRMNVTRRMTLFARLFPEKYVRHILPKDYRPGLEKLIDDYLAFNPTRNRALDMLPAFAWLDRERVLAKVRDPRVRPRPTFHYRMPNSDIDLPGWSVVEEWNAWLEVEELAEDAVRLAMLSSRILGELGTAPHPRFLLRPDHAGARPAA